MDNKAYDDLKELFGRFSGPQEAAQAAEDIERGEKLLELYPAPQPGIAVLAAINKDIRGRLAARRRFIRRAGRLVSAAAAVVVLALLGPFVGHPPSGDSSVSYACCAGPTSSSARIRG